jgi:PKD repeat protein
MKNQNGFALLSVLLAILALAVAGGVAYNYYIKQNPSTQVAVNQPVAQTQISNTQTINTAATSASISVPGMSQHTNTAPATVSVSCPTYSLPACANGTLVPQGADAKGCALSAQCVPVPATSQNASFTASPTSGQAPLKVTFSNFLSCANEEDLDFGDGPTAARQSG